MSRHWLRFAVVLALTTLFAAGAFAQASGGALHGRVMDETGGALPGVTVTATNNAIGFSRSTVTGSDGAYSLPSLPVGTYTVVADLAGFSSVSTKNVDVNVATDRALNVTLKQSAVKEQITVTAEAPLVATSPSVGTVVSQKELQNLPLNGRQFANLGSLAPGTTLSVNGDPTKPGQLTIALNGGSGRNVNFLIDGGDNTDDTIGGALQNFNIEAVQEFKIQTMAYKAEYGRSSGGVLSVVTKSGTNTLEGSLYEFYRDKQYNSETFAEKAQGIGKQPYHRHQYGFSVGGHKQDAYMAVDLRVVDTTTGDVMFTRTVEARSSSYGMHGSGYVGGMSGGLGKYEKTPTGKAIRGAIIEITDYLGCAMVDKDDCLASYQAKEKARRDKSKSTLKIE